MKRQQLTRKRLEEAATALKAAIDRGDCVPTPQEETAIRTLCRRYGVESPVRAENFTWTKRKPVNPYAGGDRRRYWDLGFARGAAWLHQTDRSIARRKATV